jgi:polar amino acid transport system substrate-binding protein
MMRRRPRAGLRRPLLLLLVGACCLTGCTTSSRPSGAPSVSTGSSGAPGGNEVRCFAPDDGVTGTLAAARRQGFLRIGVAGEAPHGYLGADGQAQGAAPAVAREVLCRLGVPAVQGRVVDFGALPAALDAGRFDMIAAGMFITTARAGKVLFSDPYFCEGTALAVRRDNPLGLDDFASVADAGARLGVLRGAVEDRHALAAGVRPEQIARFEGTQDLFGALQAGHIDAVALAEASVREQTERDPGLVARPPFAPVINGVAQFGCGAFAFRLGDVWLRDRFNDVLRQLKQEGLLPVLAPYGLSSTAVERARGLQAEDLLG